MEGRWSKSSKAELARRVEVRSVYLLNQYGKIDINILKDFVRELAKRENRSFFADAIKDQVPRTKSQFSGFKGKMDVWRYTNPKFPFDMYAVHFKADDGSTMNVALYSVY